MASPGDGPAHQRDCRQARRLVGRTTDKGGTADLKGTMQLQHLQQDMGGTSPPRALVARASSRTLTPTATDAVVQGEGGMHSRDLSTASTNVRLRPHPVLSCPETHPRRASGWASNTAGLTASPSRLHRLRCYQSGHRCHGSSDMPGSPRRAARAGMDGTTFGLLKFS